MGYVVAYSLLFSCQFLDKFNPLNSLKTENRTRISLHFTMKSLYACCKKPLLVEFGPTGTTTKTNRVPEMGMIL